MRPKLGEKARNLYCEILCKLIRRRASVLFMGLSFSPLPGGTMPGQHGDVHLCSCLPAAPRHPSAFSLCLLADDVLTKDAGECVICLEELLQGDTIARLPCLCIYHKRYGVSSSLS